MDMLSPEKAREIIEEVRVNNGGLSEEVQRSLHGEALRSIRNLQSLAGASIRHVAEDLYEADTRFIFELVQNAEDSHYSHAKSQGEEPFIYFTLYPDRITVDTNEDGFTENDVRAICSIHKSSKRQIGGYIGHKGIGFKSVFKAAHKVHIQSGPFCFSFTHCKGESGMGMITPFIQELEDLPPDVKTRFTLYLIHPEDFQSRASELKEIPDTLLLFLRRLCRIGVRIEPSGFGLFLKRELTDSDGRITLVKETGDVVDKRIYHVKGAKFENLPRHGDDQSAQTALEVILAFPVDDSSHPIIKPQHVYSFLPMRQEGFKFLIQSDFITTANRQSVHHCRRNYAIRERISRSFVGAVYHFCKDATLKYEWLQYLPGPSISDPFWAPLREMILESLSNSKILLTRNGAFDYPKSLQHPSSRHCDRHGQPLLDDIAPEVYISEGYSWDKHAGILTELGVTNLSLTNILDRLDPYLIGSTPRLLDVSLDDDWHARLADLLLGGLRMDRGRFRERIRAMPLIPSSCGTLLSASLGDIYFPVDDQGRAIPNDLTLNTVDVKVSHGTSRWAFFKALGITSCSIQKVVSSILRRYGSPFGVTLMHSVDHLKYLFLVNSPEIHDKRIFVMDQMERRVYLTYRGVPLIKDDIYFGTDGEYGTKRLLQELQRTSNQRSGSRVEIRIIHDAYVGALPPSACTNGLTWEKWLQVGVGVRRVPRVFNSIRGPPLTHLGQHFWNYHPTTFIGVLKTYWSNYHSKMTHSIIEVLKRMLVPSRYTQERSPLCHQYYPSKQLLDLCSRAGVTDSFGRFLEVPADLATDTSDEWEFLSTFSVGLRPDIRFFYFIFSSLTDGQTIDPQRIEGFFKMYEELSIRFPTEVDAMKEKIFDKTAAVCIPKTRIGTVEITSLSNCVWEGNQCLRTCHALALFPEYTGNRHIVYLFRDMLNLPNASLATYLRELWDRKEKGLEDDLGIIYDMISQLALSPNVRKLVLDTIHAHKLIYISAGQLWVGPESCVWADAPNIGGKYGISAAYSEHQALFQGLLRIQVPTVKSYIAQIKTLTLDTTSKVSEFKTAIYRIHAMYPKAGDIEDLRDLRFLPVGMPNGNIEMLRPVDTFFISDTREYQSTFHGKAPLLNFSLEENRRSYRVLEALGLEDRYISRIVEERVVVEQMDPEPSLRETRAFQRKAKHLYRCALHYNPEIENNQVSNLRQQLQRAAVYESSGFKRILVLQLNEFTITADSGNGLVHIENYNNMLHVYVPRDPKDRQRCYSSHLPSTLARFLKLKDREARFIFQIIFLSPSGSIEILLDDNGIVPAPVEDLPGVGFDASADSALWASSADSVSEDREAEDTTVRFHTPPSRSEAIPEVRPILGSENFELVHRSRQPSYQVETARPVVTSHQASARSIRPFTLPAIPLALPDGGDEPVPRMTQFVQLLCNVIRLARQATLPEAFQVPTNGSNGHRNTTSGCLFGVRSENQLAHDIKIGAAGELYVFELLQTLNLPDFGRHNWKSTIRREVTVHPDYQDLAPWNGVETADLVYKDSSSALTSLLISAGYLSLDSWRGARPTYFMEVKTTTGENNTRFFMSKGQYQRMQRMQIQVDREPNDEIYMIFRVYHLDKEGIGVQIYLDPESLRQAGRLIFTAESYNVLPAQLRLALSPSLPRFGQAQTPRHPWVVLVREIENGRVHARTTITRQFRLWFMLRLRSLLRMAEETVAKRLRTSPPTIGTHNGHFHADEALAVYLLRLLPAYTSSPLIRTRDPSLLATCHTVVDVGGEYDPARNRYDHHQRSFTTTFPQHTTKLSSAGLIYLHFGKAIIAQHTSLPVDHPDVATLYEKLYTDFVEALDANDNGISVYDSAALTAAGLQKRFRDGGINLGALVGDLNHPDPTAAEPQDEDSLFENASKFIGGAFLRKLRVASSSWLPARATVSEAYKARFDTHPSGQIVVLPTAGVPWKEHLFVLEEAVAAEAEKAGAELRKVFYVLYPESTAPEAKWRVQCVPVTDVSFESRKPLPQAWCGVRDQDLDKVLASEEASVVVPPGAVFVHANGFIGGHATREGAFAMAVRSLG